MKYLGTVRKCLFVFFILLLSSALWAEFVMHPVFYFEADTHFGIDFDNEISSGLYATARVTAAIIASDGEIAQDIEFSPQTESDYSGYIKIRGFEITITPVQGDASVEYTSQGTPATEVFSDQEYQLHISWDAIEARIHLSNFYITIASDIFTFDKAHSFDIIEGSEEIFQRKQPILTINGEEVEKNLFDIVPTQTSGMGFGVGGMFFDDTMRLELGMQSALPFTENIHNQYTFAAFYTHKPHEIFSYTVQTITDLNRINEYQEISEPKIEQKYPNPVYKNLMNTYSFGVASRISFPISPRIILEIPVGLDFIFYEGKGFLTDDEFSDGLRANAAEIFAKKDRSFDVEIGTGLFFNWSDHGVKNQYVRTPFLAETGRVSSGLLFHISYLSHYLGQEIIRTGLQFYEDDGMSGISKRFGFQMIVLFDYYLSDPGTIEVGDNKYTRDNTADFVIGAYMSAHVVNSKIYGGITLAKYDVFNKFPFTTDLEKFLVTPQLLKSDADSIPVRNIGQLTVSLGVEFQYFSKNMIPYIEYNSGNLLFEDLSKSSDQNVADLAGSARRQKGKTNGLILDRSTFSQFGQFNIGIRIQLNR